MKINFKQINGAGFFTGLTVITLIWFLFGWILANFQFAPVFKSIDYLTLWGWLKSSLPFKAPLVLFWYIILFIISILWIVVLALKGATVFKNLKQRPVYNGFMAAAFILTALILITHAVDMMTTTKISNMRIANEGTATLKNGVEISVQNMVYASGENYLNLPLSVRPRNISRADFNMAVNTAAIGIKPKNSGITYTEAIMTRPIQHGGVNVVIENFYSAENSLEAAGVSVTVTQKPLMPMVIALYILLAASVLGVIAAPRFEKTAKIEETPKKLPAKTIGKTAIAKPKKKKR